MSEQSEVIMSEQPDEYTEELWKEEKEKYGWELPKKAFFLLRLPVIRYVRWFYLNLKLRLWVHRWNSLGVGFGGVAQPYDEWVLYAIYRGWC